MLPRHPGDAPLFADAAHFRDVGLDDIERPRFQPRLEGLPAGEHFAAGDGRGRVMGGSWAGQFVVV
jgi:hypothetical protein